MPTSLNLLNLFSNDPSGYGATQTLDMTQPAFANTLSAYKTTHQQALIGFLNDPANSSINKDELYNRVVFAFVTLILEAGLTPDPTNWTQQVDAIKLIAAKSARFSINRKTITASGTYQRTPGAFLAKVLIVGGGGGSGAVQGSATSAVHATSGTCGWGMEFWLSRDALEATDATPISVTIGSGGAGATTIATNGANGASTIFGSIATVNGGLGSPSQTTHTSTNQVLNTGFIASDLTVYNGSASMFIRKIQPGSPQPGYQSGSIYAPSNTGVSPLGFDVSGSNGNSGAHTDLPVEYYGSGGRGRVIYANNQVGVLFAGQNGNPGVAVIEEYIL